MFTEITQEDVIASINSSKTKTFSPSRVGIFYSIWYDGAKYPAKEIIDRHYELKNKINPSPNFNTNAAQDRLLELGFPVVQNDLSNELDFFSQKDLVSFNKLVGRKKYDSKNAVDRNIGKYLNKISWGKTRQWAKLLRNDKWDIEGRKQWNSQHKQHKQIFKEYTWFRIIPKGTKNKKVYFTVGIDRFWHQRLLLKIDIQREDPFFNNERQKYFDDSLINSGIEHNFFEISEIPHYNWEKIVDESMAFIEDNIENYHRIVSELNSVRPQKAARICWNALGWTGPSGREGKSISDSFESRSGFANDEWLFDLDSTLDGYCYGRVEPINKSRNTMIGQNFDLMLFTFKNEDARMKWVGRIVNVEVVDEIQSRDVCNSLEGKRWFQNRYEQLTNLQDVDEDAYLNMPKESLYNMRFLPENLELFEKDVIVDDSVIKLKRYILHDFDNSKTAEVMRLVDSTDFEPVEIVDSPNEKGVVRKFTRTFSAGTFEYDNIHSEIQIGLVKYLKKMYPDAIITSENSKEINNRKIDVVMNLKGKAIYFEVKSYPNLRTCVRIALGQLIEYCFFSENNRADKLVIVSQNKSTSDIDKFLIHLRKTLKLNIFYSQFNQQSGNLVINDFIDVT